MAQACLAAELVYTYKYGHKEGKTKFGLKSTPMGTSTEFV